METKKSNLKKEKEELKKAFREVLNSTAKTAEVLLKECKNIEQRAVKLSDKKFLYEIFYHEAELFQQMNHFPQALYHYSLSLQNLPDNEKKLLANLHHKIGIIHWYMGHYDKALEHFHKNLSYWIDLKNDKFIANALSNIGTIYNRIERFEEALKYFRQALEIREKIKDKKGIAIALNNIGIAYEHKKDFDKALSYHTQSLTIKTDLQEEEGTGITLFNIGEIYYEKHDLDNALAYVQRALQIFSKYNEAWKITYCHHLIGKIIVQKEDYKEAENEFLKAMQQAEQLEADDLRKMIYQSLSELYQIQNKYKKALTYYKLFTEIKDKIFNENTAKKMVMLEHKFEVEKAEKEAAIYRLKNIELAKANELVKIANKQLTNTNIRLKKEIEQRNQAEAKIHSHQEHLQLINTILRHDLTNNLSVIKSAIKIFHQTDDIHLLQHIDAYVYKSVSLIKKMREMEKLITENKNLHPYRVSKIVNPITKNYPEASIQLSGDAYILADDIIFSIFDNLIGNAIKHADSEKIDVKVIRQKKYVEIRIIDSGIGIPEHVVDKIFEKDFTYGKSAGSGLGLHIVKKAMESISGGVFVEKNEPHGTVFVLLFRGVDI